MSREIKFRVWSKTLGKYRQLDETSNDQGLGMLFEVKKGIGSNVTSIGYSVGDVVEQFTGLKDKDGKDIYEGDVLENPKYRSVVKFGSGIFYVDIIGAGDRFPFSLAGEWQTSVVIGNAHSNPELLEAQHDTRTD